LASELILEAAHEFLQLDRIQIGNGPEDHPAAGPMKRVVSVVD
jgi:hypothetical protein